MALRDQLSAIATTVKQHLELYRALYADSRTPYPAKALLWVAIGYVLLPFDFIPDFIPVIGELDDVIIVPLLVYLAVRMIPGEVYDENYAKVLRKISKPPVRLVDRDNIS